MCGCAAHDDGRARDAFFSSFGLARNAIFGDNKINLLYAYGKTAKVPPLMPITIRTTLEYLVLRSRFCGSRGMGNKYTCIDDAHVATVAHRHSR